MSSEDQPVLVGLLEGTPLAFPAAFPRSPGVWDAEYEVMHNLARVAAVDWPGVEPRIDHVALRWAGRVFYAVGQAMVYPHLDLAQLRQQAGQPPAEPGLPEVIFSVDAMFRHLPEVARLAAGLSPEHEIVRALHRLGRDWPLSSVGMRGLVDVDAGAVLAHPMLRMVYVERIHRSGDHERMNHPQLYATAEAVRGMHPDLLPWLDAAATMSADLEGIA